MIQGRCVSCDFWNQIPSKNPICEFGGCRSKDAVDAAGGMLMPTSTFGCRFWKEREPDLREQLAVELFELRERSWTCGPRLRYEDISEALHNQFLEDADKIIAIFEKHKR